MAEANKAFSQSRIPLVIGTARWRLGSARDHTPSWRMVAAPDVFHPRQKPRARYRNIGRGSWHGAHRCRQDHHDRTRSLTTPAALTSIGEVHEGTATMDWMEQEQERGITITSAATTCFWRRSPHQHHRHARAMSISPLRWNARCVSSTARWRCSIRWLALNRSPRPCGARRTSIRCRASAFVNKMDRVGADFDRCVQHDRGPSGRSTSGSTACRLAQNPISRAWST